MSEVDSSSDRAPGDERLDEAAAYAALSKTVVADRPLDEVLEEVTLLARRALPENAEVSMTLMDGDRATTAASTATLALELDERQYDKGFGPCLDAAVSGSTIRLDLADAASPHPAWRRMARQRGVTHTLSVGFPVAAPTVGGLNVYNSTGTPFSDDSERIMGNVARFAGIVLASAGLIRDLAHLEVHLRAAVLSRAVVDQAKGIIMAQNRCSGDAAFQVLIRTSQNRNLKLRTLAEQIVASVTRRDGPDRVRGRG